MSISLCIEVKQTMAKSGVFANGTGNRYAAGIIFYPCSHIEINPLILIKKYSYEQAIFYSGILFRYEVFSGCGKGDHASVAHLRKITGARMQESCSEPFSFGRNFQIIVTLSIFPSM